MKHILIRHLRIPCGVRVVFRSRHLVVILTGATLALPTFSQTTDRADAPSTQESVSITDKFLTGELARQQEKRQKQEEIRRKLVPLPAINPDGTRRSTSPAAPVALEDKAKSRESRLTAEKAARAKLKANESVLVAQVKGSFGRDVTVEPPLLEIGMKGRNVDKGIEAVVAWRKEHGRDKSVTIPLPPPPGSEATGVTQK